MEEQKKNQYFRIGEELVQAGVLTEDSFQKMLAESAAQGKNFLDFLFSIKEVSEEDIVIARSKVIDVPYIDLLKIDISSQNLHFIAEKAAHNFEIISFDNTAQVVKFAMVDPEDFKAIETVEFLTRRNNLKPEIYITTRSAFKAALEQYKTLKKEVGEFIEEAEVEYFEASTEEEKLSAPDVEKIITEAPITKAVNVIMSHAIEGRASDVHIEPLEDETRVRYRVDGILHTSLSLPKKIHPAIVARVKVLSKLKIDERRLPQDGRFHMTISGKAVDVRVSTLPVSTGEKVVMRLLDKSEGVHTLEQLGLSGRALDLVKKRVREPYGMFLITGPTGSGKSTTLNALMSLLNSDGINIVTMEDPVEYYIEGVNQSQVQPQIGLTFASGLRSLLRQDPDVIMVGEIRDAETAEMAVHAALTGHFLLSTLHTNTAIGAIPRMLDMKIEKFLLTASLTMLMAQRLVRRICEECKKEVPIPQDIMIKIKSVVDGMIAQEKAGIDLEAAHMFVGEGCKECNGTGYKGRLGIFEVVDADESFKAAILEGMSTDELVKVAREKQGVLTMEEDGILKILAGFTTFEEIVRVI